MDYFYTARNTSGATASGVVTAQTPAQARQLLRGDGLFPLSLNAKSLPSIRSRQATTGGSKRRVNPNDLLMLTSQLAIMSRSGVDLADSLKGVAEECANFDLRETLNQVYEDVAAGETFSESLGKHSKLFGETYIVAIQAAEASGRMTEVLERLTRLQRYEIRLRNTIVSILTYPIILFFVAMMVSSALVLFVLPQFATVFADLEKPVPPSTQFLLDISTLVRGHFGIMAPVVAGVLFVLWRAMKLESSRLLFDRILLKTNGIGPALQCLSSGRMFTLMGTMLQSGIPLLDGLKLCRTASGNRLLQNLFYKLEDDVINGRGISPGLNAADCIPAGAAQMISTGERSGRLGDVMLTVGEFYEEEGERLIRQAVKILEPAIILVMGVFVSFVVMSVMLPLLDVGNVEG